MARDKKQSLTPTRGAVPGALKANPHAADLEPGQGMIVQQEFSGPLPHPSTLQQYDRICPGAAKRIITMAEEQSAHRRQLESRLLEAQIEDSRSQRRETRRGQYFGLGIGCFTILCGSVTIALGHEWAGGFIGCGGVVGLVSVFVVGRKSREDSRQDDHSSKPPDQPSI